jgi:hypothetical protein
LEKNVKNEHTLTLRQIAEPTCPLSSTAACPFTLPGKASNSFSMPAILYYITKAKMLHKMNFTSELVAIQSDVDGYLEAARVRIKDAARDIYLNESELSPTSEPKKDKSSKIQNLLLGRLLEEPSSIYESYGTGSVKINASAAKKNVTVPTYLFQRFNDIIGLKSATITYINQTMKEMTKTLHQQGYCDEVGKGLTGPPSNSSWARKLHNKMIVKLLEMHLSKDCREGLLDLEMVRDFEIEILYQRGELVK